MKTRIHVNQHSIKFNRKNPDTFIPVITVKTYKTTRYGSSVEIAGPSKVFYSPNKPLKCGAHCWIETEAEVTVND